MPGPRPGTVALDLLGRPAGASGHPRPLWTSTAERDRWSWRAIAPLLPVGQRAHVSASTVHKQRLWCILSISNHLLEHPLRIPGQGSARGCFYVGPLRPGCRRCQDSGGVWLSLSATGCISCCCSALKCSTAARSRRYWPPVRMRRAGRRPALIHLSTVLPLTPSSTPASPDDSKSARAVDLRAGRVTSTRAVYVLTVLFTPAAPGRPA